MVADKGPGASSGSGAAGSAQVARSRRELLIILLAGAVGAGLVLLGTRQVLARVVVLAPRPLPSSVSSLSGQDLRPAIAALALAALASLAAVLATRGLLRRITGLITVLLGVGIALMAAGSITRAQAVAAARNSAATPAGGTGAGTAAGSVTAGNGGSSGGGIGISGLPVRVDLAGPEWRAMMILGALLAVAAGIAVIARAGKLPVMSARYDRPTGYDAQARLADRVRAKAASLSAARSRAESPGSEAPGPEPGDSEPAGARRPARVGTGSSMWEALSSGEDPTA